MWCKTPPNSGNCHFSPPQIFIGAALGPDPAAFSNGTRCTHPTNSRYNSSCAPACLSPSSFSALLRPQQRVCSQRCGSSKRRCDRDRHRDRLLSLSRPLSPLFRSLLKPDFSARPAKPLIVGHPPQAIGTALRSHLSTEPQGTPALRCVASLSRLFFATANTSSR